MCTIVVIGIFLSLMVPIVYGDVLPQSSAVSNNRVPSVTSIEVVGMVLEETKRQHTMNMVQGGDGFLTGGQGFSTSMTIYSGSTVSTGGYYSENKQQVFDAGGTGGETYNIESGSVVTYASDPRIGSSLRSTENIQLFVAGTPRELNTTNSTFINPFIESLVSKYVGAFDSNYYAGSTISNMKTGAVQRRAEVRSVGSTNETPAALGYIFSVHPDVSSGLMYADAHVSSQFGGNTIDGLNNTPIAQSTVSMHTSASVAGLIFKFDQFYNAKSGVRVN